MMEPEVIRPMRRAALGVSLACLLAVQAAWATPPGTSPYLTGMHDTPAPGLLEGRGVCARGWVTELRYVGAGGVCPESLDYRALADKGYGLILRLDYDGTYALPPEEGLRAGYAATFADCVARAQGVRVWIVGNEPNIAWGRVFSPDEVADIYLRVKAAVDALPAGAEHQVLFPPPALWAAVEPWGDWDDGLGAAIDRVLARGGALGGLAVHAYTREFSVAAISSDAWFPGREGKWHLHFRTYRDQLALLAARGLLDLPLYITEAGNVCDPPCDPYPDQDLGYFVAMIEEVDAWNQAHPRQRIRAVTPYRWTPNDDGSGRDFCLGCSGPLQADLGRAVDLGRKWEDSECSGADPLDVDGDGHQPPGDCDDTRADVHPGAPERCGDGLDADCSGLDPACPPQGEVSLAWLPAGPGRGDAVLIEAAGRSGLTHVGLGVSGPAEVAPELLRIDGQCNQGAAWMCQWVYRAVFPEAGVYQLAFRADPDASLYAQAEIWISGPGSEPDAGDQDGGSEPGGAEDGGGAEDEGGVEDSGVDAEAEGDDPGSDQGQGEDGEALEGGCGCGAAAPELGGGLLFLLGLGRLGRLIRSTAAR